MRFAILLLVLALLPGTPASVSAGAIVSLPGLTTVRVYEATFLLAHQADFAPATRAWPRASTTH